ncbi:hypothetical protein GUJ93_ZPchr0008g12831 [Zizania palustris]|uniref:Uncharacterized protein n=1 Tax=Zizania palustris TaxID=103762 RepID=A0A8J5RP33_ZIZPA|nr:hypothetical protein GUJ93_ZPchr0008g12831 [Zizania palustris]
MEQVLRRTRARWGVGARLALPREPSARVARCMLRVAAVAAARAVHAQAAGAARASEQGWAERSGAARSHCSGLAPRRALGGLQLWGSRRAPGA